jgi:RimJ/RimL family protein N-acetyltransferase
MGFIIRELNEADAPNLYAYRRVLASEALNNTAMRDGLIPATVEAEADWLRHFTEQPNSVALIAETDDDQEFIGLVYCAGGSSPFNPHATVLTINVHPDYRGQGLGSKLIKAALDWAWSSGVVRRVELEAITRNQGAIRLYERLGFNLEGVRCGAYYLADENPATYVDAVVMAYYLN